MKFKSKAIKIKHKVLWVITARAGSKSIPDKNIKPLGGIPLLAYRVKSVLTFSEKDDVWMSTDSKDYAEIAASYGAMVPFLRPAELATDTARSADVVLHAMKWAESLGRRYDAVGLLEPTSPFVKYSQLSEAVNRLFAEKEACSIVSVRESRPSTYYVQQEDKYLSTIAKNIQSGGILRRQDLKREITPSGGFYISKWDAFKQDKSFYTDRTLSFLLPDINGLEIDEPLDWSWAEFLLERGMINITDLFQMDMK